MVISTPVPVAPMLSHLRHAVQGASEGGRAQGKGRSGNCAISIQGLGLCTGAWCQTDEREQRRPDPAAILCWHAQQGQHQGLTASSAHLQGGAGPHRVTNLSPGSSIAAVWFVLLKRCLCLLNEKCRMEVSSASGCICVGWQYCVQGLSSNGMDRLASCIRSMI